MTGYGAARFSSGSRAWVVEVRTVNHKGFDCRMRLPTDLWPREAALLGLLRARIARGHVDLVVRHDEGAPIQSSVRVDAAQVEAYAEAWRTAARLCAQPNAEPPLEWLLSREGVMASDFGVAGAFEPNSALEQGLARALDALCEMRESEGRALASDLWQRLQQMQHCAAALSEHAHRLPLTLLPRLRERFAEWMKVASSPVSAPRIEAELVSWVHRADFVEEAVRLSAHLEQMRAIFVGTHSSRGEPPGKRLGFLVGEIQREATTIAAKASSVEVAELSVDLRCEAERMREQLLNLE
jgi:uncharacterized protein (TIGR00255 family)